MLCYQVPPRLNEFPKFLKREQVFAETVLGIYFHPKCIGDAWAEEDVYPLSLPGSSQLTPIRKVLFAWRILWSRTATQKIPGNQHTSSSLFEKEFQWQKDHHQKYQLADHKKAGRQLLSLLPQDRVILNSLPLSNAAIHFQEYDGDGL